MTATLWTVLGGIAGAILAAGLGVSLANWYNRSRPWVALASIRRDDRDLVYIPAEIQPLLSRVLGSQNAGVPLRKLIDGLEAVDAMIPRRKRALQRLTNVIGDSQRDFETITDVIEDSVVWQTLSYLNNSAELRLPSEPPAPPDQTALLRAADLTQEGRDDRLFLIETKEKRLILLPSQTPVPEDFFERTRALGQILQFWVEPAISDILRQVQDEIQRELQNDLERRERLKELISSRKLIVAAKVVNLGDEPLHVSPYGMLVIKSGGREIAPIPVVIESFEVYEPGIEEMIKAVDLIEHLAKRQGVQGAAVRQGENVPEFVVAKKGDLITADLVTETPIDDEGIVNAMEQGMLSVQLLLRTAGRRGRWLTTQRLVMGMTQSDQERTELLKRAKGL